MHWTYAACDAADDLQQGDILSPTPEFRVVLETIHPHFCANKYLGFSVATQSCDLVRHGDGPKVKYISIAVVRSLKEVIPRLIGQVVAPISPGLFPTRGKLEAKRFLERLFNQNEQSLGLFYLHPDADIGLGESGVAFLRVTFALRVQHYDALVSARRGRLASPFQAKFGWLLGNLYSRAASPDWSDQPGGKKQLKSLINMHLKEQLPEAGPIWVDDELLEAGQSAGMSFIDRTRGELLAELEQHRPPPRLERIIDVVLDDVSRVMETDEPVRTKLRNRLLNNGSLTKLAKCPFS